MSTQLTRQNKPFRLPSAAKTYLVQCCSLHDRNPPYCARRAWHNSSSIHPHGSHSPWYSQATLTKPCPGTLRKVNWHWLHSLQATFTVFTILHPAFLSLPAQLGNVGITALDTTCRKGSISISTFIILLANGWAKNDSFLNSPDHLLYGSDQHSLTPLWTTLSKKIADEVESDWTQNTATCLVPFSTLNHVTIERMYPEK